MLSNHSFFKIYWLTMSHANNDMKKGIKQEHSYNTVQRYLKEKLRCLYKKSDIKFMIYWLLRLKNIRFGYIKIYYHNELWWVWWY